MICLKAKFTFTALMSLSFSAAFANECYVKGDTSKNKSSRPPGSIANPYDSLAAVEQDLSCDTVWVLYSDSALDGGIRLRNGQELLGQAGPRNALPVITNTMSRNGGHGIRLAVDNWISGIHIDRTENSGINGGEVGTLVVENLRITRFASSGTLFAPLPGPLAGAPFPAAGIEILSTGDAKIRVLETEIGEANSTSLLIAVLAGHADINLEAVHVRDQGHDPATPLSPGIAVVGFNDASVDVGIHQSSVSNIGGGLSNSDGLGLLVVDGSSMNAWIDGYEYTNPDGDGGGSATGMEIGTFFATGARFEGTVKNSVIRGAQAAGIQLVDFAPGNSNFLNVVVIDNQVYDSRQGIQTLIFGPDNGTQIFNIANNRIVDPFVAGLEYVAAVNQQDLTELLIEKNTIENAPIGMRFEQGGGATAASLRLDAGLGALGSVGRNRIVASQVADVAVLTFDCCGLPTTPAYHVDAANNWWGSSDGPAVISEQGDATVDVTPFLTEDPAN